MTVESPPKPSVKAALKQAGRNCTPGVSSSSHCKDCVKTKLAILIAITAAGPAKAVARLPRPDELLRDVSLVGPLTDETAYFVRPPRPGYVYIFKEGAPEPEQWEAYVVGSDGLLRLEPVGDLPMDANLISHPDDKSCGRPEHNAFSPQFISIDPERYPKIWMTFSESVWTDKVLDDYAVNINVGDIAFCRLARMQPFDLKQIAAGGPHPGVIQASEQALTDNVAGFKTGDINDADNSRLYFPVPRRDGQAASVAKRMAAASAETKVTGVIISLNDPAGILAETNWQRQRALTEKSLYQSEPEVAWKKLSSDGIERLRGRIKQRKKAEVIQNKTGKPWSKDNDPELVLRSSDLVHQAQFERMQKAGGLPKGAVFKPTQPGYALGHVWVPPDAVAASKAASDIARIEDQYDEGKRLAFVKEYNDKLKEFDKVIKKREADWYAWVTVKPQPGLPDLTTLAVLDHRDTDRKCAPHYVRLTGQCVGMGPLTKESLPWFEKTLKLKITNDKQILLRALFGNQRNLIQWAHEEKKDKIYDSLKSIAGAEDLKAGKWMGIAVATYANPLMAGIGAAAMALNKNGSLDKGLRDSLTRFVCATLKLWDDLEISFIKIKNAKLGDLQQGLLAAAFGKSINTDALAQATGKASRTAGRARLPSAVADKTITATLWTADKAKDIEGILKSASEGATPEQRAVRIMTWTDGLARSELKSMSHEIPSGKVRDIVTKIVKRTDSVMGNGNALMAAGVIWIQCFQAIKNLDEATSVGGAGQLDALLGLGDALTSIMGASAEVYEGVKKAKAIATRQVMSEGTKVGVRIVANGFAGVASLFNMVQSFSAAGGRWNEGDNDAGVMHGVAGTAFFGAAVASFAMAFGAKAVFFGPLLGLGPAGWAVMCTVAAVTLTYAALNAEDTDAEKFVAKNAYWSKNQRKEDGKPEPKYGDWREEASAFTALWYGVNVDLKWGDSLIARRDTVTMKVTIAEPDNQHGWRYRIWATFPNGREGIMVDVAEEVPRFPSPYPDRPTTVSAYDPSKPHFTNGQEFKFTPANVTGKDGQIIIEHTIELDDKYFQQARVEFEYFPDARDTSERARLERIEKD
jgi:hypothetical protein